MKIIYNLIITALCVCALNNLAAQPKLATEPITAFIPFEQDSNYSASYEEAIHFYEVLAKAYPTRCAIYEIGNTDVQLPLKLVVIGKNLPKGAAFSFAEDEFSITLNPQLKRPTFFINNAIHAGEPCGVDASMLFAKALLASPVSTLPDNFQVAIIPAYNLGGMLRRGQDTRANQNGPVAHGFRGNVRNLDLNRDFIKQDSENAKSLTRILRLLSPDIFLDTHTTNGSDHQYDLTVLATQPDKLGPVLGPYLRDTILPQLEQSMQEAGFLTSPYFYTSGPQQERPMMPFIETPRYSSGYTALLHTIGIITEAHALKPFARRVRATEKFIGQTFNFWVKNQRLISSRRAQNKSVLFEMDSTTLEWQVDTTQADTLDFKGFEPVREPSLVTLGERLRYNRSSTTSSPVVRFSYLKPSVTVLRPSKYFVPAHHKALLTRMSGLVTLKKTRISLVSKNWTREQVVTFETSTRPYEGHYVHYDLVTKPFQPTSTELEGYEVMVTPENLRLLTATLEAKGPDSYFSWGMFDSYLQQKEHFSSYIFEDLAAELLQENPGIKTAFETKKIEDVSFRENRGAQLNWLYKQSPYFEGPMTLPIARRYD